MPETQEAAPAAAPPPATAPAPAPATAPAPDVMPNNNQQLRCQMISLMEQQKLQQQVIPKKRTPKKDRHSKIQTAHGPRDRRMRLSLGVAREFFNLQDLLKFDKASKTVEWLLIQSRPAIKQLRKGLIDPHLKHSNSSVVDANSASSISECEVVSSGSIDDSCPELIRTVKGRTSTNSSAKAKKLKSGSGRASRKSAFHHPFAKESREKARARARERTRNIEKQRQQLYQESKLSSASVASDRDNTKPWTSPFEFEKGEEESGTQQSRNNNNIIVNNPHLDDQVLADVDEFTSSIIFSYDPHNTTPASQEVKSSCYNFLLFPTRTNKKYSKGKNKMKNFWRQVMQLHGYYQIYIIYVHKYI
ncbi:hypothetical protein NMG60_11024027 [Bertholletia excelsa]